MNQTESTGVIILVDWGNTRIKALKVRALSELTGSPQDGQESKHSSFSSIGEFREYILDLQTEVKVNQVLVSSVARMQDVEMLSHWLSQHGIKLRVAKTSKMACGVTCAYDDPSSMGVDRWLGIIGAFQSSKSSDNPVAVIDLGTSITLDVVDSHGQHLGGHILPGKRLLFEALRLTANVRTNSPPLDARRENKQSTSLALGHSTGECVDQGVHCLISGYLRQILSELPKQHPGIQIFVTGGDSNLVVGHHFHEQNQPSRKKFALQSEPLLVLKGLAYLYEKNVGKGVF